jgi:hypothetical protein
VYIYIYIYIYIQITGIYIISIWSTTLWLSNMKEDHLRNINSFALTKFGKTNVRTVGNSEYTESIDRIKLRGKVEWIQKELLVVSLQLLLAIRKFVGLFGIRLF